MVQWTAEKDQIILNGLFKFCDIKSSAPLLKFLSQEIGEGCTPKAVSHRLNHIRNGGKANSKGSSTPSKKTTVNSASDTSTPKPTGQRATSNKKKSAARDDSDSAEEDEVESPSIARAKRSKPVSYAESDDEEDDHDQVKRVKVEKAEEDEMENPFLVGLMDGFEPVEEEDTV